MEAHLSAWLGNVRDVFPAPWSEILLVAVSFLCGAAVGIERERSDKPAGLRTVILICLGSTVFTMVSLSPSLGDPEPGRIAAQIVTGVGFLGAGAILRERRGITGLTTAASVWATAAVGMVVGAGYALGGLALALAVMLTLAALGRIERWLVGPCARGQAVVRYRPEGGRTFARIQGVLDEHRERVATSAVTKEDGDCRLTMSYCKTHREHRAVLAALADVPGVEGLELAEDTPR